MVSRLAVENRRQLWLSKNDKVRVRAQCRGIVPTFSNDDGSQFGPNKLSGSSGSTGPSGKDKPIITCLEFIRQYLMKRIVIVQQLINKSNGPLTPNATKIFNNIKKEAAQCSVLWNGGDLYQATGPHGTQYVCNMTQRTCSCKKWDLTGIPCKHAVACIWDMLKEFERSLDKMESDYDKCLADNKRLGDKNKHLLVKTRRLQRVMTNLSNDNERFIADNIAKDICFFVLSSEKQVSPRSNCDVDEGPNAAAVFMANLSSTSATNSQVNEVHSNDNQIFDNVDYQLSQEMHQEEHLDSDAETEIDDNTIPYHQYLLHRCPNCSKLKITILFGIWDGKLVLVHQVVIMKKMSEKTGHVRPANGFYDKLNAMMFVPQKELSQEQAYWLSAIKLYSNCLCEDLRSACDREHTKVLELEAEVLKQQKMVIESEKRSTEARWTLTSLSRKMLSLQDGYDELSKANTHSRTAYTEKLSALTSENTKLKALVHGKTSSGPSTSEKPKVLASGMYTNSSKYIPPPKRANWVKATPLPKKKQVTFQNSQDFK
ncbi:mutator type transposase [Tanacetum coccineum]|uniref:Mutator type transposase n=1 Tax=Tanacetum coccineum TaxID=301880 RepID=A0ABQ5ACX2_9ASTR